LDPNLPAVRDVLGRAYRDKGRLPEAIEQWQVLTRLEPLNPDAHMNLGLAYYQSGALQEAIAEFKRVLVFIPHSIEGHNNLGLAYAKAKMLDDAIYHLGHVLDLQPNNPITHSNYGLALYFKGETEKAVYEWMEVTRLSPAYARAREATRLSAYDESQMVIRPLDRAARLVRFPPRSGPFHYGFEIASGASGYEFLVPWLDIARLRTWVRRSHAAQQRLAQALRR
jgi:tetratricopeptide (TPR) repeat protein